MNIFKKYIKHLMWIISSAAVLVSCNSFFEYPESVDYDEDKVFSKYLNMLKLVNQMYARTPDVVLWNWESPLYGPMQDVITDGGSAFSGNSNYGTHKFNNGSLNTINVTQSTGEYYYDGHWNEIRLAYVIIERVHEVPDMSDEAKVAMISECKTMIALKYFEMFKRFGGCPIVRKRLVDKDEFAIGRSSLQETYDFIMGLLDDAIYHDVVDDGNPDNDAEQHHCFKYLDASHTGRLTKAFAYGLKAKLALFAASPLFNTRKPYISLGDHNDLICFGDEDIERWKTAAIAADLAIMECEANGYELSGGKLNSPERNLDKAMRNYVIATQNTRTNGNKETIWGTVKINNSDGGIKGMYMRGAPLYGYATNAVTHNQVEKYRNSDGSFVNWNTKITSPVDDPDYPYESLEPRFHASVVYNGKEFYKNCIIEAYDSGEPGVPNGRNGKNQAKAEYLYGLHKYTHGFEDQLKTHARWLVLSPYMRLSELYFAKAEALNEYDFNSNKKEIFACLNAVLYRSGMSVPESISNQDEMREFIVRERGVEFFYEAQRYFDCKRWLRGNDLAGDIYDLTIKKYTDGTYTYEKVVREHRVWKDSYYLWPFPQHEINKDYGLIQNPGWD